MPRAMSFMLTERQLRDGSKTQTRRLGWLDAREGETLNAVRKCMGLKRGAKQESICAITVERVRRERLDTITAVDVRREGFADMTPEEFVAFFCKANKCAPDVIVTVIDFRKEPG